MRRYITMEEKSKIFRDFVKGKKEMEIRNGRITIIKSRTKKYRAIIIIALYVSAYLAKYAIT